MDIQPRGNAYALVNGMTPTESQRWQRFHQAKAIAQKQLQFGGTGGLGGDQGTAWLSGAYDLGLLRDPFKVTPDQLIDSSIVMLCIQWIMRTAPEAPFVVAKRKPDKTMGDIVEGHALSTLFDYPNDFDTGETLMQGVYASINLDGNAYLLKVRNGGGNGVPVELEYEPHFSIRPVSGGNKPGDKRIKNYQIFRNGQWEDIPKEDVVHFRFGIDPLNPMKGISPLRTALREVFTDNEASVYTAVLLKNMGVTNMVISPQKGEIIQPKDVPELARLVISKTTGAHKGEPLVWSDPLQIDYPPMGDTTKISAEAVRTIPQERIPALLGLNRLAVGIGADGTYSNTDAALEAAVRNNLLPTFRLLAKQMDTQLLPDFTGVPAKEQTSLGCFFVTTAMSALQPDMDALTKRTIDQLHGGLISLNEARIDVSKEDLKKDGEVWYIPKLIEVVEHPADKIALDLAQAANATPQEIGQVDPNAPPATGDGTPMPAGMPQDAPTAPKKPAGMPMGDMMPGMMDAMPMGKPQAAAANGANGNGRHA